MFPETIFKYITQQENAFNSERIRIGDNWTWSLREHVQMIFHLKHGKFYEGENDYLRAFKSVMGPIIELADWTEDIEVKDVLFYTENDNHRVLSFFVKKYHDEIYVREHNIDDMLDEITEEDNAYGGVLMDCTKKKDRPLRINLTKLAFCDQTNILGGPIGFKFNFSPSQLKEMEAQGWGNTANGADGTIQDLIHKATFEKDPEGARKGTAENETTGKNIEVYLVRGDLPEKYLDDGGDMEKIVSALYIVAFYTDDKKNKQGFYLYRKQDDSDSLKFFTSAEVEGRALGMGVGEKMLQPQVWTNFLEIHKMNLLEAASKVPLATDDEAYTNRNQIQDMESLEITTIADGKRIFPIPTAAPANINLLQNAVSGWFEQAQFLGSAFDPIMGKEAVSGTTFRGQERTVQQGRGSHDRKRGKRAKFVEQLYREVIIPQIKKEILKGKEFFVTLSSEEMQWVTERLAENHAAKVRNEAVLNGQLPPDKELLKETFKENFQKEGNQRILKILKGEFEGVEIKVGINIANKQKDIRLLSDKILAIFQFVFANPQAFQQAMQMPSMNKAFNDILEFSGINQADFSAFTSKVEQIQAPQQQPELQLNEQPQ